jgi:hypothetical protein
MQVWDASLGPGKPGLLCGHIVWRLGAGKESAAALDA